MQLIECAVPKTTSQTGEEGYTDDRLFFSTVEKSIIEAQKKFCGGKLLFVSDGAGFIPFSTFISSPRAISFIFDGDTLPLFSTPDGVTCVFACGSGDVLRAARYFALIRRVPCILFPRIATLDGAIYDCGWIRLGDAFAERPLGQGDVVCDMQLMKGSFHRAYATVLLARLAAFESRVLSAFSLGSEIKYSCEIDSSFAAVKACSHLSKDVLRGEGFAFARLLEEEGETCPEWTAYVQLTALYAAFFEKGKPRRYYTPNYNARAQAVGEKVQNVPTVEEYIARAFCLERIRAKFLSEIRPFAKGFLQEEELLYSLCKERVQAGRKRKTLKYLPERYGMGLTSIIRDFGLLEWED